MARTAYIGEFLLFALIQELVTMVVVHSNCTYEVESRRMVQREVGMPHLYVPGEPCDIAQRLMDRWTLEGQLQDSGKLRIRGNHVTVKYRTTKLKYRCIENRGNTFLLGTFGYLGDKTGVLCLGFAHIVDRPTAEYSVIRLNAHGPEKHLLSPQIVEPPNRDPPFPSINETCGVQPAGSFPLAYIRRWERRCTFPEELQRTWNYTFHLAKAVTFSKKSFVYNFFNGDTVKFDCVIRDDNLYVLRSPGYTVSAADGIMCFNITKLVGDMHYQYELSRLNSGTELENQVKLVPAGAMLSLDEEYCDYLESPARPEYIY